MIFKDFASRCGGTTSKKRVVRGVCFWKPSPCLGEQVLLICEKAQWKLPGGHVEDDEFEAAALVREFDEETGLKIGISGRFSVVTTGNERNERKEAFFIVWPKDVSRAREIASETKNVAWFPISWLPARMSRHYQFSVEKAVRFIEEIRRAQNSAILAEKK